MRKFKTVSFAVSPEISDRLSDFFSANDVSRSEWFRRVIVRALMEHGFRVENPEKNKGFGRGRRTDMVDPTRRESALMQLHAARSARTKFVGKGRQKVSLEEAAANRASRRERGKRKLLLSGRYPHPVVEEIYETVAAVEEEEGVSLNAARLARLIARVVKRMEAQESTPAGDDLTDKPSVP